MKKYVVKKGNARTFVVVKRIYALFFERVKRSDSKVKKILIFYYS